MARGLRALFKVLAVVIAAAPFVLTGFLYFSGTTSLAVVAPGGCWLLTAIFVVPVLIGIAMWRLSALVR